MRTMDLATRAALGVDADAVDRIYRMLEEIIDHLDMLARNRRIWIVVAKIRSDALAVVGQRETQQ